MAQSNYSMFETDFSKYFDPKTFTQQWEAFDFSKFAEQFKMPGMNGNEIAESQRKNIEAIVSANRVAAEGMQAVMQRQAEFVRQSLEETSKAVQELSQISSTEERFERQADLVKVAYENALSNARELAEMNAKSTNQAAELVNKRISEGLDELKVQIRQNTGKQKAAAKKH